jgi:hypothetical protein
MASAGARLDKAGSAYRDLGETESAVMLFMALWFRDLNRPIDIYCECTSEAWDAEPLNVISNFAFFHRGLGRMASAEGAAKCRAPGAPSGLSGLSSPWLGRCHPDTGFHGRLLLADPDRVIPLAILDEVRELAVFLRCNVFPGA